MQNYSYSLPEELIAHTPRTHREDAKLFVYNTQSNTITHSIVKHISDFLPPSTVLVMNDTKVLPVRLHLTKDTGGKIEVFILMNEMQGTDKRIRAITDRKLIVGQKVFFKDGAFLEVSSQEDHVFIFTSSFSPEKLQEYLYTFGETPLPHYIGPTINETDARERYQTVYAHSPGSVAAPTASLHFTRDIFSDLAIKNIVPQMVTLHVGMGTFAPINEKNFESKKLHSEYYHIPETTATHIMHAKTHNLPVMAVGTTVVRTLETVAQNNQGNMKGAEGATQIFIFPPFSFQIVDILMTNFHLPNTSLMHLVQAFLEHKHADKNIVELYKIAIQEKYKFYSFGDAMLIV